jgi:predicted RNA-binding Zn ribbon-like protein
VAARVDEANALRRLTLGSDGSATLALPPSRDVRLPLHAVALAAADLLARPERASVHACPGSGCGWLFLDPRGRRVWCSMAACGNRAKVRAHAARHR